MTHARRRLDILHHEIQELEARRTERNAEHPSYDDTQTKVQRLRLQRVQRSRILFSYAVSSHTGHGLKVFGKVLANLLKTLLLCLHVGKKVPLNYRDIMLERLAHEGRSQGNQDTARGDVSAPKHAAWEAAVTKHLDATASEGLRTLCKQPFVRTACLEREAAQIGMDKEELHSALAFPHSTGSVLHYDLRTRQEHRLKKVQETVFTQPQFVIDAIKYMIREANPEDVNAELRALDSQICNYRDLKQHLESGELTRSLLTEVWDLAKGTDNKPRFKRQDHALMLELLKGFKLLRVLGAPCDATNNMWYQLCCPLRRCWWSICGAPRKP